jgi:hypothetical protein
MYGSNCFGSEPYGSTSIKEILTSFIKAIFSLRNPAIAYNFKNSTILYNFKNAFCRFIFKKAMVIFNDRR